MYPKPKLDTIEEFLYTLRGMGIKCIDGASGWTINRHPNLPEKRFIRTKEYCECPIIAVYNRLFRGAHELRSGNGEWGIRGNDIGLEGSMVYELMKAADHSVGFDPELRIKLLEAVCLEEET